jgi:hypothetical protein
MSLLPGILKLSVPLFEDVVLSAGELVHRGNISDRAMKPDSVVMLDILCHEPDGTVKGKGCFRSDAFSFDISTMIVTNEIKDRGKH